MARNVRRVQRPELFMHWVQAGLQNDVWWLWNTHGLPDAAVEAAHVAALVSIYEDYGYRPHPWARQRTNRAFRALMGWVE